MVGDVSFFLKDTATTEIYTYGHTLSLHVALPIWVAFDERRDLPLPIGAVHRVDLRRDPERQSRTRGDADRPVGTLFGGRSEEHTSELQSLMRHSYAVFCLQKHTKPVKTSYTTHLSHQY